MENVIIIRYAEIHLKGLNRPYFEKALADNVKAALSGLPGVTVKRGESRVYVEGAEHDNLVKALDALGFVFGIHSFSPALRLEPDVKIAARALADMVRAEKEALGLKTATFKVEAKRADKRFPMHSLDIAREAGAIILDEVEGLSVDLYNPDITAYLEIRGNAYCYTRVLKGPGGMPVGCNGSAMLLLSGGIDSPVAGIMVAKRGVSLSAVHFESFPYTSDKALDKVVDLGKIMAKYTGPIKLHVVRFTDIQMKLYQDCPPDYLTILMRRFMMRIAQKLALADGCLALATGESVGQVASQTLENLGATNAVVSLPVLRPLICMDKLEITERANEYGTFKTSILPYEDCCTVFVPKHPVTRPALSEVEKAEAGLDIDAMVDAGLAGDKVTVVG